jgi:hypothetical protein
MKQRELAIAFLTAAIVVPTAALSGQEHAPLPASLVSAGTIFLINDSGDLKAYDTFYKELTRWGRFKVVTSRDAADVVAVLTSTAAYVLTIGTATAVSSGTTTTATGSAVSVPSTYLHLKIFDARTSEQVWSDSTEKWITSGHAPSKLVDNLKKRMPKIGQ